MSQNLPLRCWRKPQFSEDFTKSVNEDSDEWHFQNCSAFWKITWTSQWFIIFTWKNEDWKFERLDVNLHDKTEHVIHIRNLQPGVMTCILSD